MSKLWKKLRIEKISKKNLEYRIEYIPHLDPHMCYHAYLAYCRIIISLTNGDEGRQCLYHNNTT